MLSYHSNFATPQMRVALIYTHNRNETQLQQSYKSFKTSMLKTQRSVRSSKEHTLNKTTMIGKYPI